MGPMRNHNKVMPIGIAIASACCAAMAAFSGSAVSADAGFSLQGRLMDPTDTQEIPFDLSQPVTDPDPLTLRTWSHSGGNNLAGQAIPAGGFDPTLALFDGVPAQIAFTDNATAVPGNLDALLSFAAGDTTPVPSPLAIGNYALRVAVKDNDFAGLGADWAVDLIGPDNVLTLTLPGMIGPAGGAAGVTQVAVVGGGSTWDVPGGLDVGHGGAGALTISAGATVTNTIATIGTTPGSDGHATIDGNDSQWTNSGGLFIGGSDVGAGDTGVLTINGGDVSVAGETKAWAPGTLNLNDGSLTTASIDTTAGTLNHTGGTLTVDGGAVSVAGGGFAVNGAAGPSVALDNGATFDLGADELVVGDTDAGTLTINNGASAASGTGRIGKEIGGVGSVTVADNGGGMWSLSGDLHIAGSGTGTLTLNAGGTASVSGTANIGAGGTVHLNGGSLTTGFLVGSAGSQININSGSVQAGSAGMSVATDGSIGIGDGGPDSATLSLTAMDSALAFGGLTVASNGILSGTSTSLEANGFPGAMGQTGGTGLPGTNGGAGTGGGVLETDPGSQLMGIVNLSATGGLGGIGGSGGGQGGGGGLGGPGGMAGLIDLAGSATLSGSIELTGGDGNTGGLGGLGIGGVLGGPGGTGGIGGQGGTLEISGPTSVSQSVLLTGGTGGNGGNGGGVNFGLASGGAGGVGGVGGQGGSVTISQSTLDITGSLDLSGGPASPGGIGGSNLYSIAGFSAIGGAGGAGGAGGDGGTLTLTGGTLSVTESVRLAGGDGAVGESGGDAAMGSAGDGSGGAGGGGGIGGNGGTVMLGAGVLEITAAMDLSGGVGGVGGIGGTGNANGIRGVGGPGGDGGQVILTGGTLVANGPVDLSGSAAGNDGVAMGGTGGRGGQISIEAGHAELSQLLDIGGGDAGLGGDGGDGGALELSGGKLVLHPTTQLRFTGGAGGGNVTGIPGKTGEFTMTGGTLRVDSAAFDAMFDPLAPGEEVLTYVGGTFHLTDAGGYVVGANDHLIDRLMGGSHIARFGGSGLIVDQGVTIPEQKSITVNGSTLATDAAITNHGFIMAANALISTAGGLTNHTDLILLDTTIDGAVVSPGGSTITVIAAATFNGLVSGAGGFFGPGSAQLLGGHDPGDGVGTVTIESDLVYGPQGTLSIELAGFTPATEHDQVVVTTSVTLGGTLEVVLIDGFDGEVVPSDSFTVLIWGDRPGATEFDNVITTGLDGLLFDTAYNATSLTLTATALEGDANLDGVVDLLDLVILAGNYGQSVGERAWRQADFNQSLTVDADDLSLMAANFSSPGQDGALAWTPQSVGALVGLNLAQTPEPASVVVLGVLTLGLATRRQRLNT